MQETQTRDKNKNQPQGGETGLIVYCQTTSSGLRSLMRSMMRNLSDFFGSLLLRLKKLRLQLLGKISEKNIHYDEEIIGDILEKFFYFFFRMVF